jgi:hypothetical protein
VFNSCLSHLLVLVIHFVFLISKRKVYHPQWNASLKADILLPTVERAI